MSASLNNLAFKNSIYAMLGFLNLLKEVLRGMQQYIFSRTEDSVFSLHTFRRLLK